MARLAVLASGSGSNFEALVLALRGAEHDTVLLVCDRHGAFVLERATRLGVPSRLVSYRAADGTRLPRESAEAVIDAALREAGADLVALAGYMRLLSPSFVAAWRGRLVNVHPSPLPAWPGVDSIRRMHEAGETRFGVTVHLVDEGMDTGPILGQETFEAAAGDSLESIEARVHALEHSLLPRVVLGLLDSIDRAQGAR